MALLVAGLAGVALLIAADFSTLVQIKVLTVVKQRYTGHERHLWAMAILGAFAAPLVVGAARGRARPAMLAVIAIGAVALLITLVNDLPDTQTEGVIGVQYEDAAARPGPGFYLEAGGALLLLLSGVGGLVLTPAKSATSSASRDG